MKGAADALRLQDVGRTFGGIRAVRSVSMTVAGGERHAILGPNGAGKTTLFNLIAGDYSPTSGSVWLLGKDVSRMAPRLRARRGLSRTYQTSHLFVSLTVLDNLYLAVRGTARRRMSVLRPRTDDPQLQRARDLAARVGLQPVLASLVGELSHGEGRQLELAMALAGNPRLIMLDEPAAGLSPGERSSLTELLRSLPAEITLLLIEHDMEVALRVADVVTVMHDGSVVETGTPAEIRRSPLVHKLYLGGEVSTAPAPSAGSKSR